MGRVVIVLVLSVIVWGIFRGKDEKDKEKKQGYFAFYGSLAGALIDKITGAASKSDSATSETPRSGS